MLFNAPVRCTTCNSDDLSVSDPPGLNDIIYCGACGQEVGRYGAILKFTEDFARASIDKTTARPVP